MLTENHRQIHSQYFLRLRTKRKSLYLYGITRLDRAFNKHSFSIQILLLKNAFCKINHSDKKKKNAQLLLCIAKRIRKNTRNLH